MLTTMAGTHYPNATGHPDGECMSLQVIGIHSSSMPSNYDRFGRVDAR